MTIEEQAAEVEAEIARLARYAYTGSIGPQPKGPAPLSEAARVIADAIRLAVLRERAGCAGVAADWADQIGRATADKPTTRNQAIVIKAGIACARGIAASITDRGTP